jgi:hypothetical protein
MITAHQTKLASTGSCTKSASPEADRIEVVKIVAANARPAIGEGRATVRATVARATGFHTSSISA